MDLRSIVFQFLYGAIGRLGWALHRPKHLGFNSYMVRLEVESPGMLDSRVSRFNSYMVRLEVQAKWI